LFRSAANRALMKFGHPVHPIASFRTMVGEGPQVLFQRAIQSQSATGPHIAELTEQYINECLNQRDRHTRIYNGLPELLDHLIDATIPLCILTNKRQPHAYTCVQRFLERWPWQVILGSGDHIPKKPDPTGALKIAAQLNIAPENCLYLGDSNVDMWTAKQAGMIAAGVLWGFRDREELLAAGADMLLEHPNDLRIHAKTVDG
ncbi:MAG: HAD family hydrolase, partial [Verrucomicrobiota bacterium]